MAIVWGVPNFRIFTLIYSFFFYSITLQGCQGTTDDFVTADLTDPVKSIPVHSLILSSHRLICLPLLLFPFTMPCRIVFAKPKNLETWHKAALFPCFWPYSPMAAWIFLRDSSLVTWSLNEMFNNLRYHLITKVCFLLLCLCQGPWFTGILKHGNDKGAQQLHRWTMRCDLFQFTSSL